jgi:hypothetical protein
MFLDFFYFSDSLTHEQVNPIFFLKKRIPHCFHMKLASVFLIDIWSFALSFIKKKKNQLAYIDHVLIISNPEKDLSIVYAGL